MHGRIVLTDAPLMRDEERHDQAAVRAHRDALASPGRRGFGLSLLEGDADAVLVEDALPLAVHERGGARIEALTFAPAARRGAVQVVRVFAGDEDVPVAIEWVGDVHLSRAAYTELTPGSTLPPAPEAPVSGVDGRVLWIDDRALDAAAAIALPVDVTVPAGTSLPLVVGMAIGTALGDVVREAVSLAGEGVELVEAEVGRRRRWWQGLSRAGETAAAAVARDERAVRRGAAYVLDCAALRVDGSVGMLADHEILPLVWTRDAYYSCRFLLALAPRDERALEVVRGFLRWLFETAERPGGWWPRASFASGVAKVPAFQLDQQLFPLLVLDDHARITRDVSLVARYGEARDATIAALLSGRSSLGLVATAENPADDPLKQPYHFSSHVLLWRVLRDLDPRAAEEVRDATREAFTVEGRFAYAVAGPRGASARHYHDANDLPTVFAPGWGFCAPDDPVWRATIDFAWSERNEAFFPGPLGGLGSVHTPHPWPLGDLQEVVVARVIGDDAREARAWERLERVETWDGLLPEAYDERTGGVASRHWFAWPVALRALLRLDLDLIAP